MTAAKKAAPPAPKKSLGLQEGRDAGAKKSRAEGRPPRAARQEGSRRQEGPRRQEGGTGGQGHAAKKSTPAVKQAAPAPKKAAPAKKAPAAPKRPTVGPYAKEPKFLDEQRVLLLEERAIYKGQATDLRAEADSLALEREPGDVQFDEESGEGGTVTVDRERNLALSAQASAAVEEIDDALRKIERKTYGGCERCYQPIPKARLRALPFARLCVACKSGGLSRR